MGSGVTRKEGGPFLGPPSLPPSLSLSLGERRGEERGPISVLVLLERVRRASLPPKGKLISMRQPQTTKGKAAAVRTGWRLETDRERAAEKEENCTRCALDPLIDARVTHPAFSTASGRTGERGPLSLFPSPSRCLSLSLGEDDLNCKIWHRRIQYCRPTVALKGRAAAGYTP